MKSNNAQLTINSCCFPTTTATLFKLQLPFKSELPTAISHNRGASLWCVYMMPGRHHNSVEQATRTPLFKADACLLWEASGTE